MRERGYRGPLGLEVFNDRMKAQDPAQVAKRAHAALLGLLNRAGW